MTTAQPSLFARPDTFFGVCEGLGEDFGFNAQWLRLGLAVMLFWSPAAVFGFYAVAGLLVFASRRLFPNPAADGPAAAVPAVAGPAPLRGENDADLVDLAIAA